MNMKKRWIFLIAFLIVSATCIPAFAMSKSDLLAYYHATPRPSPIKRIFPIRQSL
jgi:hypothetical protein